MQHGGQSEGQVVLGLGEGAQLGVEHEGVEEAGSVEDASGPGGEDEEFPFVGGGHGPPVVGEGVVRVGITGWGRG